MRRPLLTLQAATTFYAIIDYARRYCRREEDLPDAASDVLDGWKVSSDPDVRELIAKGLIRSRRIVPAEPGVSDRTWYLTGRGCEVVLGRGGAAGRHPLL